MTKRIETLVEDIYDLFQNKDHKINVENVKAFSDRLAEKISAKILSNQEEPRKTLRFSNIGIPCKRKLWYIVNTPEVAEVLKPYVKIKFLFGDILEELLLFLAKEAGHNVTEEQSRVSISGIDGTRDAIIDGRLVDVKSASSRSFEKFKTHRLDQDDPFGYRDQLGAYLEASRDRGDVEEKDIASFLVIDKQLGHICLDTHPKSDKNYEEYINELKEMVAKDQPPERGFQPVAIGKSGNMGLDTVCSYCDYKHTCYPNLRTFIYASGPEYLTDVVRTPKVIETDKDGNVINNAF